MSKVVPGARRVMIYVLNTGNMYGTERMALATLAGMSDFAERVVIARPPTAEGSVLAEARKAGYATAEFRTRGEFVRALLPWFLRFRHVHMIGTGVAQGFISYAMSLVLAVRLTQLHVAHGGTDDAHSYGRLRPLNKIPVRMIAISEFVRDKLIEHGLRRDRVRVIENFVLDEENAVPTRPPFDPSQPGALPLDLRRTRVAVVSRIDPIKRIDLLFDAVDRPGLEDFVFDVYGTGADFEALRARSSQHPQICLHGFAGDVPARLADADFLLHLCPEEPFGLVVLEAFLAHVVVIVPDAGGAGSLVEDGATGLKFRANDVDDLRRVLLQARHSSPEALQRLVDGASQVLRRRFSAAQGTKRYREALSLES